MNSKTLHVLLADDDIDDCQFFKKALEGLPLSTRLTTVHDGELLIKYLTNHPEDVPGVIFLDLSMPRKTGFECLFDIKQNEKFKDIPVFVFSTSFSRDLVYEQNLIGTLSDIGAQEYIRKPGDFDQLKMIIHNSLTKVIEKRKLNGQFSKDGRAIPSDDTISQQAIKI